MVILIQLFFFLHFIYSFDLKRCPPCRGFTPKLIDFYNKYAQEKNLEIIFISSDEDEESFEEYYKEMPWLALDFNEREKKEELSDKLGVDGIPSLILFEAKSGEIICNDARNHIERGDKDGKNFPWNSTNDKKHSDTCSLM